MIAGGFHGKPVQKPGGICLNDILHLCSDLLPSDPASCKVLLETLRSSAHHLLTLVLTEEICTTLGKAVTDHLETRSDEEQKEHTRAIILKLSSRRGSAEETVSGKPKQRRSVMGQDLGDLLGRSRRESPRHRENFKVPSSCSSNRHGFNIPSVIESPRSSSSDASQSSNDDEKDERRFEMRSTSRSGSSRFAMKRSQQLHFEISWLPHPKVGSKTRRLFVLFEDAEQSIIGKLIAFVMILAIAVSTLSFILETVPQLQHRPDECERLRASGQALTVKACQPEPDEKFYIIEAVCIILFTVDYILRVSTVHADVDEGGSGLTRTLKYLIDPLNIIDILAVLPFYIGMCFKDGSLGIVRIMRLLRIMRPFKMAKHNQGVQMFAEVMRMSGQPLLILLALNIMMIVFFGSLMYYAENQSYSIASEFLSNHPTGVYVRKDAQFMHDEVSPFRSIAVGFWFVCVSMTTVGYGDISPTTPIGKLVAVVIFYIGILFIAFPLGVLSSNFNNVYQHRFAESIAQRDTEYQEKRKRKHTTTLTSSGACFPTEGNLRYRCFLLFQEPGSSKSSQFVHRSLMVTIFISVTTFILESMTQFNSTPSACATHLSVENCKPEPHPTFYVIEVMCVVIFTLDYCIRIALAHSAEKTELVRAPAKTSGEDVSTELTEMDIRSTWSRTAVMSPTRATLKYALEPLNIVDFLAIAPFYIELASPGSDMLAITRVLRLFRLCRLFKAPKIRLCAEMFADVVFDALPALMTLFFVSTLMCVLFASVLVFAESSWYSVDAFRDEYPLGVYIRPTADGYGKEVSPFTSVPYAFWWFFVTTTTVGYGDDYPTTTAGRCVTICAFYLGIVLLALPLSIVGQSFNKFYPDWIKDFEELYGGSEADSNGDNDPKTSGSESNGIFTAEEVVDPPVQDTESLRVAAASSDILRDHSGDSHSVWKSEGNDIERVDTKSTLKTAASDVRRVHIVETPADDEKIPTSSRAAWE